jgi:hypothetical protein
MGCQSAGSLGCHTVQKGKAMSSWPCILHRRALAMPVHAAHWPFLLDRAVMPRTGHFSSTVQ